MLVRWWLSAGAGGERFEVPEGDAVLDVRVLAVAALDDRHASGTGPIDYDVATDDVQCPSRTVAHSAERQYRGPPTGDA